MTRPTGPTAPAQPRWAVLWAMVVLTIVAAILGLMALRETPPVASIESPAPPVLPTPLTDQSVPLLGTIAAGQQTVAVALWTATLTPEATAKATRTPWPSCSETTADPCRWVHATRTPVPMDTPVPAPTLVTCGEGPANVDYLCDRPTPSVPSETTSPATSGSVPIGE